MTDRYQEATDRFATTCLEILDSAASGGVPLVSVEFLGQLCGALNEVINGFRDELQVCTDEMRTAAADQRELAAVMRDAAREIGLGGT